jgi:hypothetical protein
LSEAVPIFKVVVQPIICSAFQGKQHVLVFFMRTSKVNCPRFLTFSFLSPFTSIATIFICCNSHAIYLAIVDEAISLR